MVVWLYIFLLAASIALINPWGTALNLVDTGRAEIWTHPKVFIVAVLTLCNFYQIATRVNWEKKNDALDNNFLKAFISLWSIYLTIGVVCTLLSPFPMRSLLGHPVLGDGLLYWVLIAAFSCSNALLLKIRPELFKAQLNGFLIGSCILALSIFPQLINWRIDYTVTSGQISHFDSQLLESSIWQMQMPIGLYSNRGHAAFVLASSLGLNLVAIWKKWSPHKLGIFCCSLIGIALIATQARAGIISLLAGIGYLLLKPYFKADKSLLRILLNNKKVALSFAAAIICFIYITSSLVNKAEIGASELLESSTTGRPYLWLLAIKGIMQRPLVGWGFNGFGVSHIFVGDWHHRLSSYIPDGTSITQLLSIHESTFDFLSNDGEIYTGTILTNKAHNLFLDIFLSTGIYGFISYGALFCFCFWQLVRTKLWPLATVAIIYLTFTQTWFESAQFSHILWWIFSSGIITKELEEI